MSTKRTKLSAVVTVLMSVLLANTALAFGADNRAPKGCKDAGYQYNHKTLQLAPVSAGNPDSIYFVYNQSSEPINLYQTREVDSEYGINSNNRIQAHEWGVYSSDGHSAKFICTRPNRQYTYGEVVACKDKLRICEFVNVKYGLNNKGNYWLADSTSKNTAVRKTIRHGILLR